jgi:cysteine desulfurase / selenocysteine lyase
MTINVEQIRSDFQILGRKVYGKPLVYFDNGATTHKPKQVLDAIVRLYNSDNSNIHRGVHYLSELTTEQYENARRIVKDFIHAGSEKEIVFTFGTTHSINSVAFSFGERYIQSGDEIIVSEMEHHANIVPWQMLCERKNAKLKVIPINDNGELLFDEYAKLLTNRTKIVAVTHVSNVLGTINNVKEIVRIAHEVGVPVLIDGAQSIQHEIIDVQDIDCDFFAFSGHKIYGPTGIGVLYGKEKWLNELPPYMGGGDMVDIVTFEKTTYNQLPFKFEAGTSNFIGVIALAEAIRYIKQIGIKEIAAYEKELMLYATEKLHKVPGIRIYGNAKEKSAILSFLVGDIHPYDMGQIIDKMGVAVRTGTHCAQPLMQHYGIPGTLRASFAFYNTFEEIDVLAQAIEKARNMLS